MIKTQLLDLIRKIRAGGNSPQNLADSLDALTNNPPYTGVRVVNELPTTLASGEQVVYQNALWIGNAQGEAWPAVGYKEYVADVVSSQGRDDFVLTERCNTIGTISIQTTISSIQFSSPQINTTQVIVLANQAGIDGDDSFWYSVTTVSDSNFATVSFLDTNLNAYNPSFGLTLRYIVSIRIYP